MDTQDELDAYRRIIAPLLGHDRLALRGLARRLRQVGGEGWAVGEMVLRACTFLDYANGKELYETRPEP